MVRFSDTDSWLNQAECEIVDNFLSFSRDFHLYRSNDQASVPVIVSLATLEFETPYRTIGCLFFGYVDSSARNRRPQSVTAANFRWMQNIRRRLIIISKTVTSLLFYIDITSTNHN